MSKYKFEIEHQCKENQDLRNLLLAYDFERDPDDSHSDSYSREIREWEDMTLRLYDQKIEVVLKWMGDTTNEMYFDYLVHCGVTLGQIIQDIRYHISEGSFEKISSDEATALLQSAEEDDE